jgi:hypothetical protein
LEPLAEAAANQDRQLGERQHGRLPIYDIVAVFRISFEQRQ